MRWKLLFLTSLAAAVAGFAIWFGFVLATFGSASELTRAALWFALSLVIPLAPCVYAGVFAYRHTARRRKTQAVITVLLSLFFTVASYFVGLIFCHSRLYVPRTFEVRQAR
jgi:uncharacterized membrane protein